MCSAHCYSFFMWNIIFSCWNSLGVYGPIVKGGGKVRQCNVFYEVADLLSRLTISITALADEFPHVRRAFIYKIITEKLEYHKLSVRWVPKNSLTSKKKNECAVDEGFWAAINKMGNICVPTLLWATERGNRTPMQNENNSQCSGALN